MKTTKQFDYHVMVDVTVDDCNSDSSSSSATNYDVSIGKLDSDDALYSSGNYEDISQAFESAFLKYLVHEQFNNAE